LGLIDTVANVSGKSGRFQTFAAPDKRIGRLVRDQLIFEKSRNISGLLWINTLKISALDKWIRIENLDVFRSLPYQLTVE
jgi:hypothetical protein